jgi:hypothetical protein
MGFVRGTFTDDLEHYSTRKAGRFPKTKRARTDNSSSSVDDRQSEGHDDGDDIDLSMDTDEGSSTTSHPTQHSFYSQVAKNLAGSFQRREPETPKPSLELSPKGDKTQTSELLEVDSHTTWCQETQRVLPLTLYDSAMDEHSNEKPDPVSHTSGDDVSPTEEEGAVIYRTNTACVDLLWDTQHDYAWKYPGGYRYYVFLKSVMQSSIEDTEQEYICEFFANCILHRIKQDKCDDLMTVKGTFRYPREAIVWNRRTKRFEWNPYGNEAYHSKAKINLLHNARLLFEAVGTYRHLPPGQVQESKGRDYRKYSNDPD